MELSKYYWHARMNWNCKVWDNKRRTTDQSFCLLNDWSKMLAAYKNDQGSKCKHNYQDATNGIFKVIVILPYLLDMTSWNQNCLLVYFPYSSHAMWLFLGRHNLKSFKQGTINNSNTNKRTCCLNMKMKKYKPALTSRMQCTPSKQGQMQHHCLGWHS